MLRIGLTGGIGTGKSTCARIFQEIGIPVYNSDTEAKILMESNSSVKKSITELFGRDSYLKDGKLNRAFLASVIFKDATMLQQMNAIVHPAVRNDFIEWSTSQKEADYVIQESALIFETGSYTFFDKTILVDAPYELRIKRVIERDLVDRDAVVARINTQLPQDEKLLLADYIILNDGSQSLIRQIVDIHVKIHRLIVISEE